MYDTIIIGAGPGGCAAAVYVARKKLKGLLLTESFGGQSAVSSTVDNWLGEISISGSDLAKKMEDHVKAQEDFEIKTSTKVIKIEKDGDKYKVITDKNDEFETKTLILATGGRHRKLGITGEEEFDGKGVVYCSTCDAPVFADKDVAVVGAGNSGLEAVIDLLPYANKIYLMDVVDQMRGDDVLQKQVKDSGKVEFLPKTKVTTIKGKTLVSGIEYESDGQQKSMNLSGVFVEIGVVPNSEVVKDLVDLDDYGQIKINYKTKQTSDPNIFAVGDVTDIPFKQNNISAGDGVVAALSVNRIVQGI